MSQIRVVAADTVGQLGVDTPSLYSVHETGDAFTIKRLRRRAHRLMEVLGLCRVRLYDARSSCFTFLANNGVPDHILARWSLEGPGAGAGIVREPRLARSTPAM
ncbi:hypothetical protein [Streptomyces fulvorobeus]|uniref:Uncharacterized protein n=1 Tax=Streptomyces fulvorobeus TaxID=284028 RepID=A0A7Y9KZ84_9ACTN|nr:hypothetical protein [Streptomyces fulvorobeus]NYE43752.1 hypothetical protein [Streptomyces fulvorobeus]